MAEYVVEFGKDGRQSSRTRRLMRLRFTVTSADLAVLQNFSLAGPAILEAGSGLGSTPSTSRARPRNTWCRAISRNASEEHRGMARAGRACESASPQRIDLSDPLGREMRANGGPELLALFCANVIHSRHGASPRPGCRRARLRRRRMFLYGPFSARKHTALSKPCSTSAARGIRNGVRRYRRSRKA